MQCTAADDVLFVCVRSRLVERAVHSQSHEFAARSRVVQQEMELVANGVGMGGLVERLEVGRGTGYEREYGGGGSEVGNRQVIM